MTDGSVEELIEAHGEETVQKAFWLQQEIKRRGLDGIHFREKAESYAEQIGGLVARKKIEGALDRRY